MNFLHLTVLCLVVAGIAQLMTVAGVTKRALELKRTPRTCPSCGRTTRDCSCRG